MAMEIALFIHLLGVAALFAAVGISEVAGSRLRKATTVEQVRMWAGLADSTGRIFGPAIFVIIGAGIYMAADTWGFDRPFVITGIATAVIMAGVGGAFVGRGFAAIDKAFTEGGAGAADIAGALDRPALWAASMGLEGMGVGTIWVMVSKPDWAESIGTIAGLGVLAAIVGAMRARRTASAAN